MKYGESAFDILYLFIAIALYYRERGTLRRFRLIWLYAALSFLFYIPVAVAAGVLPIPGMLMLPKTVCYILMICAFLSSAKKEEI